MASEDQTVNSKKRSCRSDAPRAKKRRGEVYKQEQGPEKGPRWFKQDGKKEWIPAVYHHDIRHELLAQAPTGTYDFARDGLGDDDVTSFLPSQKTWGPERENYPAVVFEFKPPAQRKDPDYKPEEWVHNGCLVLDGFGKPIIHYRDIPDVVSSELEGYVVEAIQRIDSRITLKDIVARMPITIKRKNGKDSVVTGNALTQRTHRFRLKAGCVAWKARRGSKAMEEFLDEHLPLELKNGNSTRGFRDLTLHEMKRLENTNSELFPKKRKTDAIGPAAPAPAAPALAASAPAATAPATPAAPTSLAALTTPTAPGIPAAAEQESYGEVGDLTLEVNGTNGVLDQFGYHEYTEYEIPGVDSSAYPTERLEFDETFNFYEFAESA